MNIGNLGKHSSKANHRNIHNMVSNVPMVTTETLVTVVTNVNMTRLVTRIVIMYIHLHAKCPSFLFSVKQIWIFLWVFVLLQWCNGGVCCLDRFYYPPLYKITWKSVHWEQNCSMLIDITQLTFFFNNYYFHSN